MINRVAEKHVPKASTKAENAIKMCVRFMFVIKKRKIVILFVVVAAVVGRPAILVNQRAMNFFT